MTEEIKKRGRKPKPLGQENSEPLADDTELLDDTEATELDPLVEGAESETSEPLADNAETTDGTSEPLADDTADPEKPDETQPENHTTPAALLHGFITPAQLHALGGVENGVFPFCVYAENRSPSQIVFAEIGASVPAYAQNEPLWFRNAGSLHVFCTNFANFSQLFGWNENFGILLKGQDDGADRV